MPQIALHGRWPDWMSMPGDEIWGSLFTVIFKCPQSFLGPFFSPSSWREEILVPLMLSPTHDKFPHNLLPDHQQPTLHCTSWRHWGQVWWRPLTPCSFSYWVQILSWIWPASPLYLEEFMPHPLHPPHEWQRQRSRRPETGQILLQPCMEVPWDLSSADSS